MKIDEIWCDECRQWIPKEAMMDSGRKFKNQTGAFICCPSGHTIGFANITE